MGPLRSRKDFGLAKVTVVKQAFYAGRSTNSVVGVAEQDKWMGVVFCGKFLKLAAVGVPDHKYWRVVVDAYKKVEDRLELVFVRNVSYAVDDMDLLLVIFGKY